MNLNEWVKKYNGKSIDWDGVSPYQCVDEVKCYLQECFDVKTKGKGVSAWGDAKDYYLCFNDKSWGGYKKIHDAGFIRIANTPTFVPARGDICVMNNGKYGHVSIATGKGNTKEYYSWDQNWGGKYIHEVKHTYSFFLGVLRPPRVAKTAVNIRSGPGTQYEVLGEIKKGGKCAFLESDGIWGRIGKRQWVATTLFYDV